MALSQSVVAMILGLVVSLWAVVLAGFVIHMASVDASDKYEDQVTVFAWVTVAVAGLISLLMAYYLFRAARAN